MGSPHMRPARRVDRDLRAIGALAQAVLDGDDLEQLLSRVANEARVLVGAVSGVVVTVAGDTGTMTFRAVEGLTVGPLRLGQTMPVSGTLTELALDRGENIVARTAGDIPPAGRAFAAATGTGPLIAAPLIMIGSARGVLVVAKPDGAPPFGRADIQLVSTFATQAGSAIELFQLRAARSQQTIDIERERIARDLHDGVVQSLFGLGMTLRVLSETVADKAAAASLRDAVERLDEAIVTVRAYIEELTRAGRARLRPMGAPLGAQPRVRRARPRPKHRPADAIAAIGELARASASDARIEDVLDGLVGGAVGRARAQVGVIGTLTEDGQHLVIRARRGPLVHGRRVGDLVPLDETAIGAAVRLGRPLAFASAADANPPLPEGIQGLIGPLIVVPLFVRGGCIGALAVGRVPTQKTFSQVEVGLVEAHGVQAAVALEFERVREELRLGVVAAERNRIGRDLHERVIQLLFGVGLSLQGLEASARDPSGRASLRSTVDVLDRAIRDLRRYVFDLGPSLIAERRVHEELEALAADLVAGAGIELELEIDRVASSQLAAAGPDFVQIAREALSNVVRHAGARRCRVQVLLRDDRVVLEVTDDGAGVDAAAPGSGHGLSNIRARAMALGADLEIRGPAGVGTTVRVSVPV
jgi:two-component system, NarL family, sensor histidine kinase DevS